MTEDIHKVPFYKKTNIDETSLWLKETFDVKKLESPNYIQTKTRSKIKTKTLLENTAITVSYNQKNEYFSAQITNSKVKKTYSKKKKRENLPRIDHEIDLHYLSQAQSYEVIIAGLQYAYDNNKTCVLIITGKGSIKSKDSDTTKGILRKNVPKWLESHTLSKIILKVCPADNSHGGEGALYVQLRKKPKLKANTDWPY
jgi:DNA-nicking Smr family endonuclease